MLFIFGKTLGILDVISQTGTHIRDLFISSFIFHIENASF